MTFNSQTSEYRTSHRQRSEYNRLLRVEAALKDCYQKARCFKHISALLSADKLCKVWESQDYKRLTACNRSFIQGMDRVLWVYFYANEIEFGYVIDGKFWTTRKGQENSTSNMPDGYNAKICAENIPGITRYNGTDKIF